MKLFKTAVCFAAVSAVMVYGCKKLYKSGGYSDIAGAEVAAETVAEAVSEVITEPVSAVIPRKIRMQRNMMW